MKIIDVNQQLQSIQDFWKPHIAAELNGQMVKIAKIKGSFVWHHHEQEDELFFVLKGKLIIHLKDQILELHENQMVVIPKGVEHKPEAPEEVWLMLFEPGGTLNTGNIRNAYTHETLKRLD